MAFSTCMGRKLAYTCQKQKVHQPQVKDQTELELKKHSMKTYELLLVMIQPAETAHLADEVNDANDQAVSVAIQANQ